VVFAIAGTAPALLNDLWAGFLHGRLDTYGLSATMMVVMGLALLAPNVSATALAVSSPGQGSQAIGLANGVMFGSQLLFPFIASAIRAATSIAGVFLCFGVVALAIGVAVHAYLRMRRPGPLSTATAASSTRH